MIIQLTSGAIQYGVPMVVLLLPRVFSTTAEIPREEEKEVRRKGMSKGRDERRGEMEEIEQKKGDGGEGGGRSRQRDMKEKMIVGEKVRGGRRKREKEKEGKFHTHTVGQVA